MFAGPCGPITGLWVVTVATVREPALASNWSSQAPRRGAAIRLSIAVWARAGAAIAAAPTDTAERSSTRRESVSDPIFFDMIFPIKLHAASEIGRESCRERVCKYV